MKLYRKIFTICLRMSLPSRERGLKYYGMYRIPDKIQSLPSRERGLKSKKVYWLGTFDRSLPSRERGLKFDKSENDRIVSVVAPFAGARIEIHRRSVKSWAETVAPFAGARIEILQFLEFLHFSIVAPFAGARIEIKSCCKVYCDIVSLPSRERGLKFESGSQKIRGFCRSLRGSAD